MTVEEWDAVIFGAMRRMTNSNDPAEYATIPEMARHSLVWLCVAEVAATLLTAHPHDSRATWELTFASFANVTAYMEARFTIWLVIVAPLLFCVWMANRRFLESFLTRLRFLGIVLMLSFLLETLTTVITARIPDRTQHYGNLEFETASL